MSQNRYKRPLVTGGAGFIGSAFVRKTLDRFEEMVNLDLLTYAGSLDNLAAVMPDPRHHFVRGDIGNSALVEELIRTHEIDSIVHFAAESHVDRSIDDPKIFYRTNVEGTLSLLEVVRRFPHIHFHHVSTDEVYGSIEEGTFTESSPYCPRSPYAASKAASDHLVRAYATTYGVSTTLSHSSNNYGPCQHREKFLPRMVDHCLAGRSLPVYGNGKNVRDWLFVEDHIEAIWTILQNGEKGHSYNVAGGEERENLEVLDSLIRQLAVETGVDASSYSALIAFVEDRPGHDFRYSLSGKKLFDELAWAPSHTLDRGLEKTVKWCVDAFR